MPERSSGPPCGNNPNFRLTDGDRQVVAETMAYLAARRRGMPPTASGTIEDPEWAELLNATEERHG
ncbi:hypothetical protein [Streptomyces prunicolor]